MLNYWYNKEKPVTSIVSLGGGAFSSSIASSDPNTLTDFLMEFYRENSVSNNNYFLPNYMDTDSSGNIYVGGISQNASTQTYKTEWVVTKINSSGVIQWTNTTRLNPVSSYNISIGGIDVNADGVYVYTIISSSAVNSSWVIYYVSKYNTSTGAHVFTKNLSGGYNTQGGRYTASTKTTDGTTNQIYLWHINRQIAAGWYKWEAWTLSASDGSSQSPFYINPGQYHMFNLNYAVGYDGGMLVCGGPRYSNSQNTPEAAIYNLNTSGTFQWGRATSMNNGDYSRESFFNYCAQSSSDGAVYATGYREYTQSSPYQKFREHTFLYKWNSSGTEQYAKEMLVDGTSVVTGGGIPPYIYGCVTSSDGHLYVHVYVSGKSYLLKLDSTLSIVWQKQIILRNSSGGEQGAIFRLRPSLTDNDVYLYLVQATNGYSKGGATVILKVSADGQGSGIGYLTNYGPNYTIEYSTSNVHTLSLSNFSYSTGSSGGSTSSSFSNSSETVDDITQTDYSSSVITSG